MPEYFETDLIVGAVLKFAKLSSKEFERVIEMQESKDHSFNYHNEPQEVINAEIDKYFPLMSEYTPVALLNNYSNMIFKGAKALIDSNWREHLLYSYIKILLERELSLKAQYPVSLYWKSKLILSTGAFINHGSILGKNLDILYEKRIESVKNITRENCYTHSTLFKNMFAHASNSEEFRLARLVILWHLVVEIDFSLLTNPKKYELGFLASEAPKLFQSLGEIDPTYAVKPGRINEKFTITFQDMLSDLQAVKIKIPNLLKQETLNISNENFKTFFLVPAKRISDYFLYYPLR
jgi:hypothetical protein